MEPARHSLRPVVIGFSENTRFDQGRYELGFILADFSAVTGNLYKARTWGGHLNYSFKVALNGNLNHCLEAKFKKTNWPHC
jgi:hypothetical protein